MEALLKSDRKLLLWLQKHYIRSKFKSNDYILQSFDSYIFIFIL
jgi:hypothetical protein